MIVILLQYQAFERLYLHDNYVMNIGYNHCVPVFILLTRLTFDSIFTEIAAGTDEVRVYLTVLLLISLSEL